MRKKNFLEAALIDFNSIKVRLKRKASAAALLSFRLFQFHKGTIKTPDRQEFQREIGISIP